MTVRATTVLALLFLAAPLLSACVGGAAFLQGVSEGLGLAQSGGGQRIMLFGGQGHETFLGCFSCSSYESDSVFNSYGSHGSPYAVNSIFNQYGRFGSPYSPYSACNPYAADPPVFVDENGSFYGRLTLNIYHSQAETEQAVLKWLRSVCDSTQPPSSWAPPRRRNDHPNAPRSRTSVQRRTPNYAESLGHILTANPSRCFRFFGIISPLYIIHRLQSLRTSSQIIFSRSASVMSVLPCFWA